MLTNVIIFIASDDLTLSVKLNPWLRIALDLADKLHQLPPGIVHPACWMAQYFWGVFLSSSAWTHALLETV